MSETLYLGNAQKILKGLENSIADSCITSPPYYGLRDYGDSEQMGLEESPQEYVKNLADLLDEIKRILKPKGTLWLNLGDSYCGTTGRTGGVGLNTKQKEAGATNKNMKPSKLKGLKPKDLKPKDLIGIPWSVAFELRSRGWYLRQDIIWSKPNCMPESVKDRCTKSHEYLFLLSKNRDYYYDVEAIKEPYKEKSLKRLKRSWAGDKKRSYPGGGDHNNFDKWNNQIRNNNEQIRKVLTRKVLTNEGI